MEKNLELIAQEILMKVNQVIPVIAVISLFHLNIQEQILSGDMEDTRFIKSIVDIEKNSQANLKDYKKIH